jgi:ubiquinone/menaquinone biosynthesis C-methylase UbiE
MDRIPEPTELMSDEEQARTYAEVDFTESEDNFMRQFSTCFPDYDGDGLVLDLGCGPANITRRFAKNYAKAMVHGVDGSAAMLKYGNQALESEGEVVTSRTTLIQGFIPGMVLPADQYDVIVSKSLLHHLPDPQALWTTIKQHSRVGTKVLIVDLYRPASREVARQLVETYSGSTPEIHQTDFYNSLLASFTVAEVEAQLLDAGLSYFIVQTITDRHQAIYGTIV